MDDRLLFYAQGEVLLDGLSRVLALPVTVSRDIVRPSTSWRARFS
jgi:hypothetical protein